MATELRFFQSVLYWCFDKELYLSVQSTRSWAYAGSEHLTLKFTIPPLAKEIAGLRLSLQPCPAGAIIQTLRFSGAGEVNTWSERDIQIVGFGTLDARISPYAEPASAYVKGSCAIIQANEKVLRCLNKGGTLELVLSLALCDLQPANAIGEQEPVSLPASVSAKHTSAPDKKVLLRTPAVAREIQEIHNEVRTLNAIVNDFYRSNTWKWTAWCRDLSPKIRRWQIWSVYQLLEKQMRSFFSKPLKGCAHQHIPGTTDIIIPVYNGLEHVKHCLDSVLASSSIVGHEVIVIDDASSEKDLCEFLNELTATKRITLLRNKVNSGFTATVNRGMQLHPERDVVLLNSDTTVSHDWLGRLQRAAYLSEKIGTVTPFSNNGSICSYPKDGNDQQIPVGYQASTLDLLASSANAGKVVKIPTSVGHCMYIKRQCLDQVGYFDGSTFPGYGEENDFSMRACKVGWTNVLATDTFVFHAGSASYGESQYMRKRAAYDALAKIHPEYQELVNEFVRIDPVLPFRRSIDLLRLQSAKKANHSVSPPRSCWWNREACI